MEIRSLLHRVTWFEKRAKKEERENRMEDGMNKRVRAADCQTVPYYVGARKNWCLSFWVDLHFFSTVLGDAFQR